MKKLKVFVVVSGVVLVMVCMWKIATQSAYDHSQDAAQSAEKTQAEIRVAREKAINELSQQSTIATRGSDVYVVVKTVWDESLGVERVIVEREEDGEIAVLTGKPGTKFIKGEKVQKITIRYRIWKDFIEIIHYCVPLSNTQTNSAKK